MSLHLDDAELDTCVQCGLCLPHCPTWRVTGDELESPRGRIAAMREAQHHGAPLDDRFTFSMDTCIQCRNCEPVCPANVPFGRLMEGTRATMVAEIGYQAWWRRAGYRVLGHHRLLLALSSVLAVLQRFGLVPARLGLPRLPVRRAPLVPSPPVEADARAWLFTGCVMDAWLRPTHAAALRVLESTGVRIDLPGGGASCCGALHVHAGLLDDARGLARRVMAALPGDGPILVDSAGCGAALKDYGHLLSTSEASAFSARVLDVHEYLAGRLDRLPAPRRRMAGTVAIQDPCHLRHVQRAHLPVRAVLGAYADLVELDDEGLCCGAGGAFATSHPDLAGAVRDRKLAAIGRSGATTVASANPGCAMHLAAAGLIVRHPVEIIDDCTR